MKDRADALEKYKCCPKCTLWRHNKRVECPSNAKCNKVVIGKTCGAEHSSTVCGSGSAYCGSARASRSYSVSNSNTSFDSSPDIDAVALNLFQDVNVLGCSEARTCWDNGSNRVLVTHDYAKAHKLRPQEINFKLDVPGHVGEVQQGVLYEFTVVDNSGCKRKIWAYGIDKIMNNPDPVDLRPVQHLFPHLPCEFFLPLEDKPVDLLIGTNFFQLHPDGGQGRDTFGYLKALQSKFGHGWVIGGTHPSLKLTPIELTKEAFNIARVNKLSVVPEGVASFWAGDSLGVCPPKRCDRCLGCQNCSDPALIHSREKQEELKALKKNCWLADDGLHVNYVFKKDPACSWSEHTRDCIYEIKFALLGLSEVKGIEGKPFCST